jgi:hypothetical protein
LISLNETFEDLRRFTPSPGLDAKFWSDPPPAPIPIQLWEILVPTVRKDGGFYTTRFHRVWDGKVREISGGLTVLHPTKGQWVSPSGELCIERMIPVRIACTEQQIEMISDITASYYQQEAVLYYRVSDKVVIKHYRSK